MRKLSVKGMLVMSLVCGGAMASDASTQRHGNWRVACAEREEGPYCTVSQAQSERESGQRILTVELHRGEAGAVRGALALPFGLALPGGVRLSLDDEDNFFGEAGVFSTCLPDGCIVPLHLDAAAIGRLGAATVLKIHAMAAADGQRVMFEVSLTGLTEALKAAE